MSILSDRVRVALVAHGRTLLAGAGCALAFCFAASPAMADQWGRGDHATPLIPGNLLLATSEYVPADIQAGVTQLPPECSIATPPDCATAIANGFYPFVFNNDSVDAFFGVTSPVYLDELTPWGQHIGTIPVPDNQFVTSFSSKSELALNLSVEGKYVSFVGYVAKPGGIDVSNANTPGVIDPGNGDVGPYYRVVAQLDRSGHFTFTETNAFSGDNGRAAITNDENGQDLIYAAGNAGQSKTPPAGVVASTGAQFITPSTLPEADQNPAQPTPLGSFDITELGQPLDKATKDNNYRGIAVNDNVVYYTKGSGGNGVDTVYFVDTTGKACPSGVGLPESGAQLPTSAPALTVKNFGTASKPNNGLTPENMCILKGFPTNLVPGTNTYPSTQKFPFGLWFANDHTLYVADEGSGDNPYANGEYTDATASNEPDAGLEKWVFDSATQQWNLAYTLQNGLDLGQPYTVPGYPTGINADTGLPWSPATDGLRQLTGRVNPDGTVTIWATTSTVSGGGDQGADPNKLVEITDRLDSTNPTTAAGEHFRTLQTAHFGEVLRGVSFTPGTSTDSGWGWGWGDHAR
ncbi:MAG TPA: hypothetical protein VMF57_10530 [Solirubrobacteraceae bacterium]|nr:hypothetical protein [Solirubrobacteraceae bacterium]